MIECQKIMCFKKGEPYSITLDMKKGMSGKDCRVNCFYINSIGPYMTHETFTDLFIGSYKDCLRYYNNLSENLKKQGHEVIHVKPFVWWITHRFVVNYPQEELKHLKKLKH